jgi:ElaB/YqjD/DUF883 family membrane-anchored ribosome-binding protein
MSKGYMNNNVNKSEKAHDVFDDVADKVKSAGKAVREFSEDTQDRAYEIRDVAANRIRSNPFGTAAIIFVSGLVLGAILRK